jgi:Ca2+/Na+ antiporter
MWKWPWSEPERFDALFFKHVADGWIFRSPISWTFGLGPRSYFLVSDRQKDDIAKLIWYPSKRALILVAIATALPMLLLMWVAGFWSDPQLRLVLVIVLCTIYAQCMVNFYFGTKLRPLLAGARRTTERFTFAERLRAHAAVISVRQSIFACLFCAAFFVLSGYNALTATAWDMLDLAGVVLFGFLVVYLFAMLAAKREANHLGR